MTGLAETITRAMGGTWTGHGGTFPTPGHSADDRGMSVRDAPDAPDGVIINTFNGGDPLQVKDQLRAKGILPARGKPAAISSTAYVYRDAAGADAFRMVRTVRNGSKAFHVEHRDPAGNWTKGMNGAQPLPYRLPELIAAHPDSPVYIVEGEKDADNLAARGLVATTNPNGAGKWRPEYATWLQGRECVILPDNDAPGRDHAAKVAASLLTAGIDHVVVELPGLPEKGDVSDWLAKGGTVAGLDAITSKAWDAPAPTPVKAPKWGSLSAVDLAAMKFDPLRFVVPGILPEGLTLLAGKPKFGKSFFVLDIAVAVASGGVALGSIQCERRDVLYLALEDSRRRLQDRLNKMLPDGQMPARLILETSAKRIGEGLLEQLTEWLDDHPNAGAIIIDVLRCVKPRSTGKLSGYDEDANALNDLQRLAASRPGLAIIVVHHTRKMEADDAFDTISGTLGLTGVADTLMVLAKHGDVAKLSAQGRDLDGYEKAMTRDPMTGGWRVNGDARELAKTSERQAMLNEMREHGEPITPTQLASALGKKRPNINHLLRRLETEGLVTRGEKGRYSIGSPFTAFTPFTPDDDDYPDSEQSERSERGSVR